MPQPVEYYNQLADQYDQLRFANSYGRYIDSFERSLLNEWLKDVDKFATIDFGCGTGRLLDFAMIGIDGSAKMLHHAIRKFPDRTLINCLITKTPLVNGIADAAFCFHVLMHLDIDALHLFLKEAARIIRPGGRLIIDIPSAPRRAIFSGNVSGWHAATSATLDDVAKWTEPYFEIKRWQGMLFIPIHRLPSWSRSSMMSLDAYIGRSRLATYSSYYLIELVRLS